MAAAPLIDKIMIAFSVLLFVVALLIAAVTVLAICFKYRLLYHHRQPGENGAVGLQAASRQKSVTEGLPAFEYRSEDYREGLECAVCLSDFEENERGRTLPRCKHSFHMECIDPWFRSHSTCPICRTAADPPPAVFDHVAVLVES